MRKDSLNHANVNIICAFSPSSERTSKEIDNEKAINEIYDLIDPKNVTRDCYQYFSQCF